MIELGDKVRFAPHAFLTANGHDAALFGVAGQQQTGEVCYINQAHGWYRVRYMIQGQPQHECFRI